MTDGTDRLIVKLERNAIERDRVLLRQKVRSLPVSDDDGLWVRTQVLRFLDEVTTVSPGAEDGTRRTAGHSASEPTSAAALNGGPVVPEQPGSGSA